MHKKLLVSLAAVAAIALTPVSASAQAVPSLGSAQNFGVLGATTVTNTGSTLVTGELGVSPGTSITGFPPGVVVGGTIHRADMTAARAQADAHVASAGLKALPCPSINNLTGRVLGAEILSLPPGVYCFSSSAQLTGTLVLTGAGPWIFQIGTALTTASNSQVVVLNAVPNCGSNVFWQVGSAATLGTGTRFVGNILASTESVTLTTGVTVSGSVISLIAAVTMDTNGVSACQSGPVVPPMPPPMDKCEDHHHGHDDDHHGDHDGHHDGDHHHGDHDGHHDNDRDHDDHDDGHHGDKDHKDDNGKDHKDGDRDRDNDRGDRDGRKKR